LAPLRNTFVVGGSDATGGIGIGTQPAKRLNQRAKRVSTSEATQLAKRLNQRAKRVSTSEASKPTK